MVPLHGEVIFGMAPLMVELIRDGASLMVG